MIQNVGLKYISAEKREITNVIVQDKLAFTVFTTLTRHISYFFYFFYPSLFHHLQKHIHLILTADNNRRALMDMCRLNIENRHITV